MKNDLLTQRVIRQEVSERVNIKHEEMEKYYNEHKTEFVREERLFLREIFISTEGKDAAGTAAAEKKAKDLVARARKGERFAEMARDNSDSVTAKSMGELPPFKKGDLAKNLEDQVWSQPKGYITDPVRTGNGFLILRVEDHQKAGQAELSEVENEIIGEALCAPHAAQGARVSHETAQGGLPRNQGRLYRQRRCRGKRHGLGGSGAAQARNREQDRSCKHAEAQEAAVGHTGSRHHHRRHQFLVSNS